MDATLDRDTHAVTTLLHAATTASGLSQAGFARALGTSPPRLSTYLNGSTHPSAQFCMRAHRLGHALNTAATQGLMSAPATATLMRRHLLTGETEWVWRMLLQGRDHLALMLGQQAPHHGPDAADHAAADHHAADHDAALADSWEAAPTSTGADGWDALLAAITAHQFDLAATAAPPWTRRQALETPWMPEHPFLSAERIQAQTPTWLRRWNIYIPERDLITA